MKFPLQKPIDGLPNVALEPDQQKSVTTIEKKKVDLVPQAEKDDKLYNTIINGDLASLSQGERLEYYKQLCEKLGLNPLTKPFGFIRLDGKLTLYAFKGATDQLGRLHNLSYEKRSMNLFAEQNLLMAEVRATGDGGRYVDEIGALGLSPAIKGEAAANAYMKCWTKAKRRATLSYCGLGFLDESEVRGIPGAVLIDDNGAEKTLIADHIIEEPVRVETPKEPVAKPVGRATSRRTATNDNGKAAPILQQSEPAGNPAETEAREIETAATVDAESVAKDRTVFAFTSVIDRARLVSMIRAVNPGVTLDNLNAIGSKFKTYTTWATVEADLAKMFPPIPF